MLAMARKDARKRKGKAGGRSGPYEHSDDNDREILTNVQPRDRAKCLPTRDPYDRAHKQRAPGTTMFVPAAGRGSPRGLVSKPRRYHPSQMTSRGVGFDSSFDAWWQAYLWLMGEGVELGGRSDSGVGLAGLLANCLDDIRLRDVLHQRTRQSGMTRAELEVERAGSAILADAGVHDED